MKRGCLVLVLFVVLLGGCGETPVTRFPAPATAPATSNHAAFEALLSRHVAVDGRVDYARWQASAPDVEALDRYLGELAAATPDTHPAAFPTPADRMAYWINLYNALVVREVVRRWPLETVRDVQPEGGGVFLGSKGFFQGLRFEIGGAPMSLDDIEHETIRARYKDARVHFVINCGSTSCPALGQQALNGPGLEAQLEAASRAFVADTRNVSVDHSARILTLSKIFDWYGDDFRVHAATATGEADAEVIDFLMLFAETALGEDLAKARREGYAVEFFEYDWSVNDHPETVEAPSVYAPIDTSEVLFELPTATRFTMLDGSTWRPEQTLGKVVVLDFWATYCAPCRRTLPEMATLAAAYDDGDVVVIAVSIDGSQEAAVAFLDTLERAPVVGFFDADQASAPPFEVTALPTELLVDRRGRVRARLVGAKSEMVERLRPTIEVLRAESP